jgi:hypothetical protein
MLIKICLRFYVKKKRIVCGEIKILIGKDTFKRNKNLESYEKEYPRWIG